MKSKVIRLIIISVVLCCVTALAIPSFAAEEIPTIPSIVEVEESTEPTQPTEEVTQSSPSNMLDPTLPVTFSVSAVDADYEPIANVGYTLYFVSSDLNSTTENIEQIDKSKLDKTEMALTDQNGKSSVTLSAQGIYLVSCETVPETVSQPSGDFVVFLPYTADGSTWQYDLEATPKLLVREPGSTVTSGAGSDINTNGNGNGLDTNGAKATVNTGGIAACICIPLAILFLSVGFILVVKTNKLEKRNKKIKNKDLN